MTKVVKRILNNKIFLIVISILTSLLLWIYITSTEAVEDTFTFRGVEVKFLGEDTLRESSGLIITSVDHTTVDLELYGPRRVLAKLKASDLAAIIDLSKVTHRGDNRWGYKISYPPDVDESSIRVLSSSANVISFYVDKLSTKSVDVKGSFDGTLAEGYIAEEPEFEPLTVRISGPQDAIDKVSSAWVSITRENVDMSLEYTTSYVLKDAQGQVIEDDDIALETPEVTVKLSVLAIKEVPLTVTIIDGGGATSNNAVVTIEPRTIKLAGDAETMKGINKLVLDTIDLSDFEMSYEETFAIVLPDDTESLSGVTEAKVTVEIKGLATKSFSVTNIECINAPKDYIVEVITESLNDVKVRAPQEVLDKIQSNNLRAVADLSNIGAAAGVFNPAVKIRIDGYPSAGVVGDYKIFITLKAP